MLVLLCLLQILPQQLERLRPVVAELRQRLPECVDAGLFQPTMSSVTVRPAVRCVRMSSSRSSSANARCIVFGFTPASAANSRTDGSLPPGGI